MKTSKTILLAVAALFLASCGGNPSASSEPIVPTSSESPASSVKESLPASEESVVESQESELIESSEFLSELSEPSEESGEPAPESLEPESEETEDLSFPSEESVEEPSLEPTSEAGPLTSEEESVELEESSEEEASSLEDSSDSEIEESFISEEESSEEDSGFAWRMTRDDIPPTAQSKYNIDFSFEVSGGKEGQTVSFFGSYMQQGSGEWNGLIQMKKGEGQIGSYFYLVEGPVSSVEIAIHRRVVTYGGEAHDFTGVPTISQGTSFDSDDWSIIEAETKISEDENTIYYRFEVSKASFMVANYSFYALYIDYVANSI